LRIPGDATKPAGALATVRYGRGPLDLFAVDLDRPLDSKRLRFNHVESNSGGSQSFNHAL
jgi:hypothetical protein